MTETKDVPIRDASTVIVMRDKATRPRVLMGQRGAKAAFMPNKFVFPGGAVDKADAHILLANPLADSCRARLVEDAAQDMSGALAAAAIRELWEETGQILGQMAAWTDPVPDDWVDFANRGYLPDASALSFVFRAITPPGRPRRFDARFFLVDADALASDPDDFDAACDELSHLQWVPVDEVRKLDMPFITEVVLAEIAARATDDSVPDSVPFFKNNDEASLFLRLNGRPMTD